MLWDTVTESLEKEILAEFSTDSLMQTFQWGFLGEKALRVSSCRWSRTSVFSLIPVICGETIIGREKEDSLHCKVSGQSVLHTFWGPFFIQQSLYSQFWKKRIFPDNWFSKEETYAAFISNKTLDLLVSRDPNIKRFSRLRPMIWFCQSIFSEKTEYNILQVWLVQPVTFMVMRNTWLLWR